MFFSMEPDKFFPYTQIDVVQFPSGLGGNDIIEKHLKDRFFNYSFAAVEEALSNAVYHCAYDEWEAIEVRVENDRIEIVELEIS